MKKADATTQHGFSKAYIYFLKEEEKNWKLWRNNATLIFTHPYSSNKETEFPSYIGVLAHATMPHRSWNASMKFSKKKMKKADATTQHWFSYAYTKFFKEEEKSWKGWRNNATLIFKYPHSTTKKAELPSYTKYFLMQ